MCFLYFKSIQRMIGSLCLVIGLSMVHIAHAEQSGAFVGGSVSANSRTQTQSGTDAKTDTYGVSVLFGYRNFYTQNFGLRYYMNVDFSYQNMEEGALYSGGYGLNIDMLYNFFSRERTFIGIFLGLDGGLSVFGGSLISGLAADNASTNKLSANAGVHGGFRFVLDKNHSLEIVAGMPFVANKIVDNSGFEVKTNYYASALRYTYNF